MAKKAGHAEAGGYKSAFEGIAPTQENAASLIRSILNNPTHVSESGNFFHVFDAAGRGVKIMKDTGRFIGFLERSLEKK